MIAKTFRTYYAAIFISVILLSLWSCNEPNLNGHYHLIWSKKRQDFQTWNIRDNRMIINGPVCLDKDSCFASLISFTGNVMTVSPWVDFTFKSRFKIDDTGIVTMYGDNDTLSLVPHNECISAKTYFNNKTKNILPDFDLSENQNSSTGIHRFPHTFENELIIGGAADSVFYIFNNERINKLSEKNYGFNQGKGQSVWIHVDYRSPIGVVAPIISELFEKGYLVQLSTMETMENDEQIKILNRSIKDVVEYHDRIEIEVCDHCEKYLLDSPDVIVPIKMLGGDSFIINGDTNDLFQTRNAIVRFIGQDRLTRLRSQIQIEIDRNTPFHDYLGWVDELLWIHIDISSITYYNGRDDVDAAWIRDKQENFKSYDVAKEFPIRVKEIIQ